MTHSNLQRADNSEACSQKPSPDNGLQFGQFWIGKGEVESSILSGSTIKSLVFSVCALPSDHTTYTFWRTFWRTRESNVTDYALLMKDLDALAENPNPAPWIVRQVASDATRTIRRLIRERDEAHAEAGRLREASAQMVMEKEGAVI